MIYHKSYMAYTLIELMLVMAISIILFSLVTASYRGSQSTMLRNEAELTLVQDIHSVQRMSLLLSRPSDEKWPYGIGLDISNIPESGHINNVEYYMFRWCSPLVDPDSPLVQGKYPNYHPNPINSKLPPGLYSQNACKRDSSCNGDSCALEKILGVDNVIRVFKKGVQVNRNKVAYILFESITGRVFFYDSYGNLLNYNSSGDFENNTNAEIWITSADGKAKKITIHPISGGIDVTNETHSYDRV